MAATDLPSPISITTPGRSKTIPAAAIFWMFEQGGDLENPIQPNVAGVEDWHELSDPETFEYRGLMDG